MLKRYFVWILLLFCMQPVVSQQVMYTSMKGLLSDEGDTVRTLHVEKRSHNQVYLTGGADFRITAEDNEGLSKYLKSRCYGVCIDDTLYVNCRRMRYKRYRFGNWYAPALRVGERIFFRALPLGQVATSTLTPDDATKLGGNVGNAIHASGLVDERVYYMLSSESSRALFVGKELMYELLEGKPVLQEALMQEANESASVIEKYILQLR